MAYYVDDYSDGDTTVIKTDDLQAALTVALELGERDGLEVVLYDDGGAFLVNVSAFRRAYLDALETGEGREDFGAVPLYRGDVMNSRNDTTRYDAGTVYYSETGRALKPWREELQDLAEYYSEA